MKFTTNALSAFCNPNRNTISMVTIVYNNTETSSIKKLETISNLLKINDILTARVETKQIGHITFVT